MKKCDEYQEMVSAYIDNELADNETSKLFYHLGECAECRSLMKSMMQLRTALREAEFGVPKQAERKSFWKKSFSISYPIAALIACMMLVSSLFFIQRISQPPAIVEKIQTEYVYMTSYPTVYAVTNSSTDVKTN
ncbi:MAG: zf-HC2 domain-containing protein [Bacteroidota bacterium]|nr:zf-HC2 domain-containing protein [Bacteroidota bacterium]